MSFVFERPNPPSLLQTPPLIFLPLLASIMPPNPFYIGCIIGGFVILVAFMGVMIFVGRVYFQRPARFGELSDKKLAPQPSEFHPQRVQHSDTNAPPTNKARLSTAQRLEAPLPPLPVDPEAQVHNDTTQIQS